MIAPILTFFNNKGGVGKTSLVYHLAWMFASLGKRVIAFDFDPQANLTAAFLDEDQIDELWNRSEQGTTIYRCVRPLAEVADILEPVPYSVGRNLYLLPGDVALSGFEDVLSREWPNSMGSNNLYRPLRTLTSFWQVIQMAVNQVQAELVLVDIGPNLGAINRSVLLATDFVAIPLAADLFSLQGLSNLGPTLRTWRSDWHDRLDNWKRKGDLVRHRDFAMPQGTMTPIGYLCQQHGVRLSRVVKAYDKWAQRIPSVYREKVLEEAVVADMQQETDPYCLATIKHYRSLVPMGQEYRKPIFYLTPADGAIGSHAEAVRDARADFKDLATKIAALIGLQLP